jgi:hypothetical protein
MTTVGIANSKTAHAKILGDKAKIHVLREPAPKNFIFRHAAT